MARQAYSTAMSSKLWRGSADSVFYLELSVSISNVLKLPNNLNELPNKMCSESQRLNLPEDNPLNDVYYHSKSR